MPRLKILTRKIQEFYYSRFFNTIFCVRSKQMIGSVWWEGFDWNVIESSHDVSLICCWRELFQLRLCSLSLSLSLSLSRSLFRLVTLPCMCTFQHWALSGDGVQRYILINEGRPENPMLLTAGRSGGTFYYLFLAPLSLSVSVCLSLSLAIENQALYLSSTNNSFRDPCPSRKHELTRTSPCYYTAPSPCHIAACQTFVRSNVKPPFYWEYSSSSDQRQSSPVPPRHFIMSLQGGDKRKKTSKTKEKHGAIKPSRLKLAQDTNNRNRYRSRRNHSCFLGGHPSSLNFHELLKTVTSEAHGLVWS